MISVDGVRLEGLGFVAQRRTFPTGTVQRGNALAVPGTVGGVLLGAGSQPGRLVVEGYVSAEAHEGVRPMIDALTRAVQGARVVRFDDIPDREWHGVIEGTLPGSEIAPQWAGRAAELTLDWTLPDPTAVARQPTLLRGTDLALVLGSAPSTIRVDVTNGAGATAVTQIVVAVLAGGLALHTLTWNGSLPAGSAWRVSDQGYRVTTQEANAIDGLTPESVFPYAAPAEGADRITVAVTGGVPDVRVRFRPRWW